MIDGGWVGFWIPQNRIIHFVGFSAWPDCAFRMYSRVHFRSDKVLPYDKEYKREILDPGL